MTGLDKIKATIAVFGIVFAVAPASAEPFARAPLQNIIYSHGVPHAGVCQDRHRPGFAHCHARAVTNALGYVAQSSTTSTVAPAGYGPTELRAAYAVPANAGSPSTTIAIIDAFGYYNAESDLAVYRATYGLPPCTTANTCFKKVNQRGSTTNLPAMDIGWAEEAALDLDMASAMCPQCKILLVQASSDSYANLAAAVNMAAALGAHVISNSYGGAESGTQRYEPAYNHPSIAIVASSGDSGYGTQFPASSPHVIAVGGTSLTSAEQTARGWTESAWDGSGSGCSDVYPKPAWQHDQNCTRRMEADVAAVADPATGVAVYTPTGLRTAAWQIYGGTSVAAPLVAGMYGANGGIVGWGDPYANPGALFDILSGTNGTCAVAYHCNAVVGYDGPTGLGTPNGLSAF